MCVCLSLFLSPPFLIKHHCSLLVMIFIHVHHHCSNLTGCTACPQYGQLLLLGSTRSPPSCSQSLSLFRNLLQPWRSFPPSHSNLPHWMCSMLTLGLVVARWQHEECPLGRRVHLFFNICCKSWRSFPPTHSILTGCMACSH